MAMGNSYLEISSLNILQIITSLKNLRERKYYKHMGINVVRSVQDLYKLNFKTLFGA